MKKLIITSVLLFACSKENVKPKEPVLDCDCDRVAEANKFWIVGDGQTGKPGFWYVTYITINECTKVQKHGEWNSTQTNKIEPKVGVCL